MVHALFVHVTVYAVTGPTNSTGYCSRIEPHLVCQGLQGFVYFFTRVNAHKQVFSTLSPFHASANARRLLRITLFFFGTGEIIGHPISLRIKGEFDSRTSHIEVVLRAAQRQWSEDAPAFSQQHDASRRLALLQT